MSISAAHLDLLTQNLVRLTDMHMQSPPALVPQTNSAKLPTVSFPFLRLDPENRLEPVKYFTWRARLLAQVDTLKLDRSRFSCPRHFSQNQ